MPSIHGYLTQAILLILVASSVASVAASYILFRGEMRAVYDTQLATVSGVVSGIISNTTTDDQLKNIAEQLSLQTMETHFYRINHPIIDGPEAEVLRKKPVSPFPSNDNTKSAFAIAIWSERGQPRIVSHTWLRERVKPIPFPGHAGFWWENYHGVTWRVYCRFDSDSHNWIMIGLRRNVLVQLSSRMVLAEWTADALSVVLAALLIYNVIRRAIRPINMLSKQLKRRDEQDLSPVKKEVPIELDGLKTSLNDFMERLNKAIEQERRFTADAAHELRTPLAALKIHLDNIRHAPPEKAALSLEKIRLGIERLQRVIDQLLTLAHVDRHTPTEKSLIGLYPIAAQLAGEMLPIAEKRGQQLSITGLRQITIKANATETGILLRNLLDNALRYTPEGGTVELHLAEELNGAPSVSVIDDGPGIAPELIDHVTDRFRRGNNPDMASGSGLGLSIVSGLLKSQQATLSLDNIPTGGLKAKVVWNNKAH